MTIHRTTIGGIVLLTFSIALYVLAGRLPGHPMGGDPGSALIPRLLAVALLLLSISLIAEGIRAQRRGHTAEEMERHLFHQQIGILLLTLVYVAVMPHIGFLISTFLYLLAFFKYAGTRGYAWPGAMAAGVDVLLFYSFRELLSVPLPEILGV